MTEPVSLAIDARGVARLTLARPERHNAMDAAMIAALDARVQALGRDPGVRVIVLAATGASFCAGGDLAWMRAQMGADAATRAAAAQALAAMLATLDRCPRPLIGRVQGNAFGGGIGLMAVCDVVVGASTARFGLTETRLGLIPATIGPYVVARMGAAAARRVFMSGRIFGAEEAQALGLLARSVAPVDLDAAVAEEVEPYLACAPGAVADAKALLHRLAPAPDAAALKSTVDALVARWEDAEAKEGISAFFDRRKPDWTR